MARERVPDYKDAPAWPALPDSDGLPPARYEDLSPAARASIERARSQAGPRDRKSVILGTGGRRKPSGEED